MLSNSALHLQQICRCLQAASLGGRTTPAVVSGLHTSPAWLKQRGIVFKHRPSFRWAEEQAGLADIPYTTEALPQPLVEEVFYLHKNFWRRHLIALVGNGERKRWIIAGAEMQVGDFTTSHPRQFIPDVPVANPKPGDAYPIGALPVGSTISCVEQKPGEGAKLAVEGGTSATYVRALPDGKALVVTPSKQEMIVSQHCTVMVGQVSGSAREKFKSFNEKRRYGIKQRSGFRQKKGDRFGRRIKFYTPRFDCTAPYPVNYDIRSYLYTWPGEGGWSKPLPRFVADYSSFPRYRWNQQYIKNRQDAF
uniref:Ribosomal_L2_C domain-containing protein n=1 Tax=Macrostomum lignano TaxID=282301 RepID=A0A1I8HYK2_9PLAT